MNVGKNKWKLGALALAGAAALCAGAVWALQSDLTVTEYPVELPTGLEGLEGLTIAQIADVHSADIQEELKAALEAVSPHLIVFTGDLINREDRDLSRALSLAAMAAKLAPAYFVPGNHEADNPCYPELREGLEAAGVTLLEDQAAVLEYPGGRVNLMGVRDLTFCPEGREAARAALPGRVAALLEEGALNVLLCHRPSLLAEYAQGGADLAFTGHAHGGQVRLPLVGPLFAPDEGVLPAHTAGVYQSGKTRMVVSRGLGNGTPFPRLWNGPELVAVTLHSAGQTGQGPEQKEAET